MLEEALEKLDEMVVNGTYICKYPEDPYIKNIVTVCQEHAIYCAEIKDHSWGVVSYKYLLPKYGDILSKISISKFNEPEIFIVVGNETIYYKKNESSSTGETYLYFEPGYFGIPMISLQFRDMYLIIKQRVNDLVPVVKAEYMLLSLNDRKKICQTNLVFDEKPDNIVTIKSNVWSQTKIFPNYLDEPPLLQKIIEYIVQILFL